MENPESAGIKLFNVIIMITFRSEWTVMGVLEQPLFTFKTQVFLDHFNPRRAGGGAFLRPPPLRFFADISKTAARSAAVFWHTLSYIFSA